MKETIIEIPNYIRQVELSKSRRRKYFIKDKVKKLPKKYEDITKYSWKKDAKDNKFYLIEDKTGEKVIANPKAHGTPKVALINGQSIYNGSIKEHSRNTMMKAIREFITPYLKDIKIEKFPIKIVYEYHALVKDPLSRNQLWDLRNREFPYGKEIEDTMQYLKVIPEDNILHLDEIAYVFRPIDKPEDNKLVIRILEP